MYRGHSNGWIRVAGACVLVALVTPQRIARAADTAPSYSAQSIVNAATQTVVALAPNTIATIYGTNLSFSTVTATSADVKGGTLPTSLGGVTVFVGGLTASLFYVSPTQINFLIPYEYVPGTFNVIVARQSLAGPTVKVQLNATSPGMFQWNGNYAIASHLSGKIISSEEPAKAGEIVILYAVGLGRTSPDTSSGRVVSNAAKIVALSQLQVSIAGKPVAASDILYAGLAPGFAGLYQINLRMPDVLPQDPEIRISVGAQSSPPKILLAAQAAGTDVTGIAAN